MEEVLSKSPDRTRAILAARAKVLAFVPPAPSDGTEILTVITFALGGERYAVESRFLHEIVRVTEIAPVPRAPAYFAGVANVRGEILALVDLRKLLGIGVKGLADLSRILVLGRLQPEIGLLADVAQEITTLRRDALFSPASPAAIGGPDLLLGVTNDALIVLDGEALLDDPRLFADSDAERAGETRKTP
jgi:purine-binding chemotaxis protein CheW